jgi:hypothetical protein
MSKIFFISLSLMICLSFQAFAQQQEAATAVAGYPADSAIVNKSRDTTASLQGVSPDTTSNRKIELVRRNFNYRYQIGAALGMMLFIALIFTTVQNWNPD